MSNILIPGKLVPTNGKIVRAIDIEGINELILMVASGIMPDENVDNLTDEQAAQLARAFYSLRIIEGELVFTKNDGTTENIALPAFMTDGGGGISIPVLLAELGLADDFGVENQALDSATLSHPIGSTAQVYKAPLPFTFPTDSKYNTNPLSETRFVLSLDLFANVTGFNPTISNISILSRDSSGVDTPIASLNTALSFGAEGIYRIPLTAVGSTNTTLILSITYSSASAIEVVFHPNLAAARIERHGQLTDRIKEIINGELFPVKNDITNIHATINNILPQLVNQTESRKLAQLKETTTATDTALDNSLYFFALASNDFQDTIQDHPYTPTADGDVFFFLQASIGATSRDSIVFFAHRGATTVQTPINTLEITASVLYQGVSYWVFEYAAVAGDIIEVHLSGTVEELEVIANQRMILKSVDSLDTRLTNLSNTLDDLLIIAPLLSHEIATESDERLTQWAADNGFGDVVRAGTSTQTGDETPIVYAFKDLPTTAPLMTQGSSTLLRVENNSLYLSQVVPPVAEHMATVKHIMYKANSANPVLEITEPPNTAVSQEYRQNIPPVGATVYFFIRIYLNGNLQGDGIHVNFTRQTSGSHRFDYPNTRFIGNSAIEFTQRADGILVHIYPTSYGLVPGVFRIENYWNEATTVPAVPATSRDIRIADVTNGFLVQIFPTNNLYTFCFASADGTMQAESRRPISTLAFITQHSFFNFGFSGEPHSKADIAKLFANLHDEKLRLFEPSDAGGDRININAQVTILDDEGNLRDLSAEGSTREDFYQSKVTIINTSETSADLPNLAGHLLVTTADIKTQVWWNTHFTQLAGWIAYNHSALPSSNGILWTFRKADGRYFQRALIENNGDVYFRSWHGGNPGTFVKK